MFSKTQRPEQGRGERQISNCKIQKHLKALPTCLYLIVAGGLFISPLVGCRAKNEKTDPVPTAVIQGGSMAPALLGEHYPLNCDDCNFPFPVDAANIPESGYAACPNCGYDKTPYEGVKQKRSKAIPIQIQNPRVQRWDLVAFRFDQPKKQSANQNVINQNIKNGVKRIVGLPGETILIQNGDIWLNGKIAERSWAQKTEMMISHYDSRYIPSSIGIEPRWNLDGNRNWTVKNNQFVWRNDADNTSKPDSLSYQPAHCFASQHNRKPINYIPDSYGFNQNHSRIELNAVDQIFVEFPVELAPKSYLTYSTTCGGDQVVFKVDPERKEATIRSGSQTVSVNLPTTIENQSRFDVGFCTFDFSPTLLIDGRSVCKLELAGTAENRAKSTDTSQSVFDIRIHGPEPTTPNALAKAPSATLGPIRIYRDLYYFSNHNSQFTLADDEYLLLGDNVPISIDSRHWHTPTIRHQQIIGTLSLESAKID